MQKLAIAVFTRVENVIREELPNTSPWQESKTRAIAALRKHSRLPIKQVIVRKGFFIFKRVHTLDWTKLEREIRRIVEMAAPHRPHIQEDLITASLKAAEKAISKARHKGRA